MSELILKQLRKNRESSIEVEGITYYYRRPTDIEALAFSKGQYTQFDVCKDFVTGWKDVTEDTIIGNGCFDPVEFGKELWSEWLADNPKVWTPLANAILDSYKLHLTKLKDQEKN